MGQCWHCAPAGQPPRRFWGLGGSSVTVKTMTPASFAILLTGSPQLQQPRSLCLCYLNLPRLNSSLPAFRFRVSFDPLSSFPGYTEYTEYTDTDTHNHNHTPTRRPDTPAQDHVFERFRYI